MYYYVFIVAIKQIYPDSVLSLILTEILFYYLILVYSGTQISDVYICFVLQLPKLRNPNY